MEVLIPFISPLITLFLLGGAGVAAHSKMNSLLKQHDVDIAYLHKLYDRQSDILNSISTKLTRLETLIELLIKDKWLAPERKDNE